jgi:hypothetical protein
VLEPWLDATAVAELAAILDGQGAGLRADRVDLADFAARLLA